MLSLIFRSSFLKQTIPSALGAVGTMDAAVTASLDERWSNAASAGPLSYGAGRERLAAHPARQPRRHGGTGHREVVAVGPRGTEE